VDEITDFVIKYHTLRNPFKDIFKVDKNVQKAYDVMRVDMMLKYDISFGCYEKASGKLVGVFFASMHDKNQNQANSSYSEFGKNKCALQAALRFLQHLERDLFLSLSANRIMLATLGTVHPDYAGHEIAPAIINHLLKYAHKNRCDHAVGVGVSLPAQKVNEKIGFTFLKEVKYADYVDPVTGKKTDLDLSPIHTHARVYYYRVPPQINQSML